jgi:hypothetical protein
MDGDALAAGCMHQTKLTDKLILLLVAVPEPEGIEADLWFGYAADCGDGLAIDVCRICVRLVAGWRWRGWFHKAEG